MQLTIALFRSCLECVCMNNVTRPGQFRKFGISGFTLFLSQAYDFIWSIYFCLSSFYNVFFVLSETKDEKNILSLTKSNDFLNLAKYNEPEFFRRLFCIEIQSKVIVSGNQTTIEYEDSARKRAMDIFFVLFCSQKVHFCMGIAWELRLRGFGLAAFTKRRLGVKIGKLAGKRQGGSLQRLRNGATKL